MGRISDLSPELILLVLDVVRKSATIADFKAALFTCRQWYEVAQLLLYRDIVLHNDNIASFVPVVHHWNLETLLKIRSLTVALIRPELTSFEKAAIGDHRNNSARQQLERYGSSGMTPLIKALEFLPDYLARMTKLHTFSFDTSTVTHDGTLDGVQAGFRYPRTLLSDLLMRLPGSCENVNLETGTSDQGDWEGDAQKSALAQQAFNEVMYKVMCSVRRFRISIRAFNNHILGWSPPLAHAPSSPALEELMIIVENERTPAAQGQYPLTWLRSASFRSRFKCLQRCVIIQKTGNNHGQFLDDHFDSYMIRDILRESSVFLPLMQIERSEIPQYISSTPNAPRTKQPSVEVASIVRDGEVGRDVWLMRVSEDLDFLGTLPAMRTVAEQFAWCAAPNGCIIPRSVAQSEHWSLQLQICSRSELSSHEILGNTRGRALWRTEAMTAQKLLGPKQQDSLTTLPTMAIQLPSDHWRWHERRLQSKLFPSNVRGHPIWEDMDSKDRRLHFFFWSVVRPQNEHEQQAVNQAASLMRGAGLGVPPWSDPDTDPRVPHTPHLTFEDVTRAPILGMTELRRYKNARFQRDAAGPPADGWWPESAPILEPHILPGRTFESARDVLSCASYHPDMLAVVAHQLRDPSFREVPGHGAPGERQRRLPDQFPNYADEWF